MIADFMELTQGDMEAFCPLILASVLIFQAENIVFFFIFWELGDNLVGLFSLNLILTQTPTLVA